jgi:hypothetical protein
VEVIHLEESSQNYSYFTPAVFCLFIVLDVFVKKLFQKLFYKINMAAYRFLLSRPDIGVLRTKNVSIYEHAPL